MMLEKEEEEEEDESHQGADLVTPRVTSEPVKDQREKKREMIDERDTLAVTYIYIYIYIYILFIRHPSA